MRIQSRKQIEIFSMYYMNTQRLSKYSKAETASSSKHKMRLTAPLQIQSICHCQQRDLIPSMKNIQERNLHQLQIVCHLCDQRLKSMPLIQRHQAQLRVEMIM